jgi:OFA family oxalate/formate antiporter-like MFS transporter
MGLGGYWCIGNLIPYVAVYVRVLGDKRSVSELEVASSRIFFAASLCLLLVPTPSAFLQRRLGVIPTCVLGAVLCQLATLACAGLTELQAFVLVHGFLFGTGCGLGYGAAQVAAVQALPEKKSLAAGLVSAGFAGGPALWSVLQTAWMNPENVTLAELAGDPEFPARFRMYFRRSSALGLGLVVLGNGLMTLATGSRAREANAAAQREEPLAALRKPVFWRAWLTIFTLSQNLYFIGSLWKVMAVQWMGIEDDDFLSTTNALGMLMNVLGRVAVGFCADRIRVTKMLRHVATGYFVLTATLVLPASYSPKSFLFWILGLQFCCGGLFALLPGLAVDVIQTDVAYTIAGLLSACAVASQTCGHFITLELQKFGWKTTALSVATCSAGAIFLASHVQQEAAGPLGEAMTELVSAEDQKYADSGIVSTSPSSRRSSKSVDTHSDSS